jgi:hypothetical protein
MPWDAYTGIERIAKERGFRSLGRYFLAVAIADIFEMRRQGILKDMANSDPKVQDKILTELILFRGRIDDVIELAAFLAKHRKHQRP